MHTRKHSYTHTHLYVICVTKTGVPAASAAATGAVVVLIVVICSSLLIGVTRGVEGVEEEVEMMRKRSMIFFFLSFSLAAPSSTLVQALWCEPQDSPAPPHLVVS